MYVRYPVERRNGGRDRECALSTLLCVHAVFTEGACMIHTNLCLGMHVNVNRHSAGLPPHLGEQSAHHLTFFPLDQQKKTARYCLCTETVTECSLHHWRLGTFAGDHSATSSRRAGHRHWIERTDGVLVGIGCVEWLCSQSHRMGCGDSPRIYDFNQRQELLRWAGRWVSPVLSCCWEQCYRQTVSRSMDHPFVRDHHQTGEMSIETINWTGVEKLN
jgi:hypothetical protein